MSAGRGILLCSVLALIVVSCSRPPSSAASDAAPPAPPPPPTPAPLPVADAAPETRDTAADAPAAPRPRAATRKPAAPPTSGAGGAGPIAGLKLTGSLPKEATGKVLHAQVGALHACYEHERAKTPDLHGRVNFRLTVDDRGRVSLAEVVTSTLGGGDSELCMVHVLRDLKFPRLPQGEESTASFQMTFGR
jgi:outer membrane biosynthesis protein TonB